MKASGLDTPEIQDVLSEMYQEACQRGKTVNFKMISGSMSPIIKVGNVVKVNRVEPSRIRIGDIIAFHDGRGVVVHRVIGRSHSDNQVTFRHRGDAGAASGTVMEQALIGRVTVIKTEEHEVYLNSKRRILSNRILGWRLGLLDSLSRVQPRLLGIVLHLALRPLGKACRRWLLRPS